jgi:hypothetical protein
LPLARKYTSEPAPGSLLDLGTLRLEADEGLPMFLPSRTLHIGNTGTADLRIDSISIVGPSSGLQLSNAASSAPSVSFPHIIRDNSPGDRLTVTLENGLPAPGAVETTLEVVSNDPDTPVARYTVRYARGVDSHGIVEFIILWLTVSRQGSAVAGPLRAEANGPSETATLDFEPNAPHSLTTEIPSFLGGGSVEISNFTGRVTVSLHPIPNDTERAVIRIETGAFTAPSFRLPPGLETGPNTLTFGPATQSEGILVRSNGSYTIRASAMIVNDLYPQGFPVQGNYSGTFNEATGQASVQSESQDYFEISDRVEFIHGATNNWLTWTRQGVLETATNVLGPWISLTNAVSPYVLDTTLHPQKFFRLRVSEGAP